MGRVYLCRGTDSLASEFSARGIQFHKEIVNRSDGLRGFEVLDHDGYALFFGRPFYP
ncbi:MAG TPA: hypothetical protein VG273_20870 [Bryobacteraceae bacterium]|nr:hypothetical protein [Bryobacteraceae bacterium]